MLHPQQLIKVYRMNHVSAGLNGKIGLHSCISSGCWW